MPCVQWHGPWRTDGLIHHFNAKYVTYSVAWVWTGSSTSIEGGPGILCDVSCYLLSWERRDGLFQCSTVDIDTVCVYVSQVTLQPYRATNRRHFVSCVFICCTELVNISGADSCLNRNYMNIMCIYKWKVKYFLLCNKYNVKKVLILVFVLFFILWNRDHIQKDPMDWRCQLRLCWELLLLRNPVDGSCGPCYYGWHHVTLCIQWSGVDHLSVDVRYSFHQCTGRGTNENRWR